MAKIRTFSRYFPGYHARAGEETFFVEKMIQWYWDTQNPDFHFCNVMDMLAKLNGDKFTADQLQAFNDSLNPEVNEWKNHTIRAGMHFKAGDKFRPCVWTGRPYNSKQLQFLPELEVVNTWELTLIFCDKTHLFTSQDIDYDMVLSADQEIVMAGNDGLSHADFLSWFNKPFEGQIICWEKSINY